MKTHARARVSSLAVLAASLVGAFSLAPSVAHAMPAEAGVVASASTDVVVLLDMTRIEGRVLDLVPGRVVRIETADGFRTLQWTEVLEVITTAPKRAASAPGDVEGPPGEGDPTIITRTTANASGRGASFKRTRECAGKEDEPKCRETIEAKIDEGGPRASYASEADCSKDPGNVRCRERTNVDVGKAGISASYKQEKVERVKVRPSSSVNFGLDLSGGGVFGDGFHTWLVGSAVKMPILVGSRFPDAKGGGWFGVSFEPSAAFFGAFTDASGSTSTSYQMRFGGSVGLQAMHFGSMDQKTLKQSGFGVRLGGFAGANGNGGQGDLSWSPSYGPELGLVFPSYNAGTAKYSALAINAMVLPLKDSVTFVAGLGFLL
jgi:hypothetical protein